MTSSRVRDSSAGGGRTLASAVMAVVAAALWLVWNFEHEHTSVRAPWTGLTYAGSALAFVAVGILGRGWRALAIAVVAAATTVLVDAPVWDREPSRESTYEGDCDPGCVSLEAAVVISGVAAAALSGVGIVLRRAGGLARLRHT